MPIFEFRCKSCSKIFEELILGNSLEVNCPECGGREVEKLLSTFSMSGKDVASSTASSCGPCTPNPSKCSACR